MLSNAPQYNIYACDATHGQHRNSIQNLHNALDVVAIDVIQFHKAEC